MGRASKAKGSAFERDICKALSLWVTDGERKDVFWRSAMSGGRATVARKRGADVRQAGDITAVAPEGHALTDRVFIECKHYANLQIEAFILSGAKRGVLAGFWTRVCDEADERDRTPWLIAKQNLRPTLLLTEEATFIPTNPICLVKVHKSERMYVYLLDEVLSCKPPKEYQSCASSVSTSTASATRTPTVGRVRL